MGDAYRKGNLLFQQGRYKLAIEQFLLELQAFPGSAVAHSMLSLALKNDNQKKPALAAAQQGVQLDPELAFAHYALGWAVLEQDQPRRRLGYRRDAASFRRTLRKLALKHARKARELEPHNAEFHWFVAALQYDLRLFFPALESTFTGLSLDPHYIKLWRLQILCLRRLRMFKRARVVTEQALSMQPNDAELLRHRGWLMLADGKVNQANDSFIRSLQLDPSDKDAQRGFRWSCSAMMPLGAQVARVVVTIYGTNGRAFIAVATFVGIITVVNTSTFGRWAAVACPGAIALVTAVGLAARRSVAEIRFRRLCRRMKTRLLSVQAPSAVA